MSKKGFLTRYFIIIEKIRKGKYVSLKEIREHIEQKIISLSLQDDTLSMGFSERTLKRDIREIRNLFGISIEYSRQNSGYYIEDEIDNLNFQPMLEAFDLFNSMNIASDLSSFVFHENRRPKGTEHLFGIIHAIKNRKQIKFEYRKFDNEHISTRLGEPYALKEFKNRWYLLMFEQNANMAKTFALGRISTLEILRLGFTTNQIINFSNQLSDCFGIIRPTDRNPENVILSFTPLKGKFIKSLPLHKSQQIISENENEFCVKLRVFITYDFILEILSHGSEVRVIEPPSLVAEIKKRLSDALAQY
ncbi:MAG: WYL domain-containing protein [Bacteroidales bacterium]|nr:WYL domain-containing protein [Bacteroidales bacterium]